MAAATGCPSPARPTAGQAGRAGRAAASRLELADVFRAHGQELSRLTGPQQQAVRAITSCRTAALGGHVHACDRCGYRENRYNSCRNRYCPKCQGLEKVRWIQARRADLLPVEYHHVVFTIPQELHPIFRADATTSIRLFFASVSETLQEVAENPKRLGARIGFTAVLHTRTQTLREHPHVHCIVPGGGLSPDGDRWISAKPGFFLPVRVLSVVFRGKLLSKLEAASAQGRLSLGSEEVPALLARAAQKKWVVYSKPPVAGPEQVLDYLGRYTHRIAISNERLVSLADGRVTFRWKDRAQEKLMTLEAAEFLRRFLRHVLPKGLVRIRHFGFLANSVRRKEVAHARDLLEMPEEERVRLAPPESESWNELLARVTGRDVTLCPNCRQGRLQTVEALSRVGPTDRIMDRGRSP